MRREFPSAVTAVIELGFPKLITQASYQKGMRASDLIDYLEDTFSDLEEEERVIEERLRLGKIKQEKTKSMQERETLVKETCRLYSNTQCAKCYEHCRTHVLLPCSHFALCSFCVSTQTKCPLCQQCIELVIHTFY